MTDSSGKASSLDPRQSTKLIFLNLILLIHFGYAVNTLHAEETMRSTRIEAIETVSSSSKEMKGMDALATYYANWYQGRRTSSGEIFDQEKLTAAHPTLPHGTRVKLINLANDKSVVVKINDRCRKRNFEIIDLSRKAAQELGFYGKYTARVTIVPLPEG